MERIAQLRLRVNEFLNGSLELDAFEDWFLSNNWNSHLVESPKGAFVRAVHRIEGALLDFSSEAIGEDALKREMKSAIRPFERENVVMVIVSPSLATEEIDLKPAASNYVAPWRGPIDGW